LPRQIPSLHPAPIVDDRERRVGRVGEKADARRAGVERVRHGFGKDRLFEGAGVRVAQVFEEMLQVNSGLAHVGILSRGGLVRRHAHLAARSENRITVGKRLDSRLIHRPSHDGRDDPDVMVEP